MRLWEWSFYVGVRALIRGRRGFPGDSLIKNPPCRRCKIHGFHPWVGKTSWWRAWQPTPVFLPGKFHGQRSLVGYGPWGLSSHTHTRGGRDSSLSLAPSPKKVKISKKAANCKPKRGPIPDTDFGLSSFQNYEK